MQVQVLKYSATTQDDGTFRLDAEHYQEKYLNNQQRLIKFRSTRLLDMVAKPVITGHTPSMKIESYYGGNIGFANLGDTIPCEFRGHNTYFLQVSRDCLMFCPWRDWRG